uniref:LemA family protein n=1 Tax=Schlesneria paludicola TaxID=360056 RepID=A0A7C2JYX8_9PLAN
MSKNSWLIWLVPAAAWAVYMCWLAGYRSGYEQGHTEAWDSARKALMTVSKDLPHHYQSVAFQSQAESGRAANSLTQ